MKLQFDEKFIGIVNEQNEKNYKRVVLKLFRKKHAYAWTLMTSIRKTVLNEMFCKKNRMQNRYVNSD